LDVNTTGALLITNDGMLCYHLTHPSFQVPKTYLVRVRGGLDKPKLDRLRRTAESGRGKGKKERGNNRPIVELVKQLDKAAILKITLYEGRHRQVRKMCEAVGLRVVKLKRVNFGPVSIRNLPVGSVRPLTKKELDRLQEIAGIGESKHGH
jgi:23S rRNA pseudouridine2605 synthase